MNKLHHLTAAATLALASLTAQSASQTVNVAGIASTNLLGEAGNTVLLVNIGANAVLTSFDWTVTLDAFSPSSLAEMQVSFSSSSGLDQITFAPGAADVLTSGSQSYAGSLDLSVLGATMAAGSDGLLRIEFSEAYKDFAVGVAEGQWVSGSLGLTVSAVPEPASAGLALFGLALVGGAVRRARRD